MPTPIVVLGILAWCVVLIIVGYRVGRGRGLQLRSAGAELSSTPDYYGWYALVWMLIPVSVLSILVGTASLFDLLPVPAWAMIAAWFVLPLVGLALVLPRIVAERNTRIPVERTIYALLLSAALISILTTFAIILSVVFESWRFFSHPSVSVTNFFFGTEWNPGKSFLDSMGRGDEGGGLAHFGAVPLFTGTFLITALAMMVAVPIGVLVAIYLSEFASRHLRRSVKPVIEVLAGIPTVVYGFFAALTVAPGIVAAVEWLNAVLLLPAFGFELGVSYQNGLAAGLIMGVMIIPLMSSLCDDVMTAVPMNLRQAALACGATRAETIKQVVLPAALPGLISAFLLSVSRAVGETMIVYMAAGLRANLTGNPLDEVTTVTVHIVTNLTGDLAYDNPQTLSAFALGLVLLALTLLLNVASLMVVRRFRVFYEGD